MKPAESYQLACRTLYGRSDGDSVTLTPAVHEAFKDVLDLALVGMNREAEKATARMSQPDLRLATLNGQNIDGGFRNA